MVAQILIQRRIKSLPIVGQQLCELVNHGEGQVIENIQRSFLSEYHKSSSCLKRQRIVIVTSKNKYVCYCIHFRFHPCAVLLSSPPTNQLLTPSFPLWLSSHLKPPLHPLQPFHQGLVPNSGPSHCRTCRLVC